MESQVLEGDPKAGRIKYDRALLNKVLERDGATLVGSYEKLTCGTIIKFICKCNTIDIKPFRTLIDSRYSGVICKKCSKKIKVENTIKTNIERYGVKSIFHSEDFKVKIKETILNKYGVENVSQIENVKEKKIETTLQNYGVENPFQSTIIKEKSKEANKNKYGYEYASKSEIVKNKAKETNLQIRGVEFPLQSKDVKEKSKQYCLEKYGCEYASQSKEVKDKIIETNINKYGTNIPSKSKIVKDKIKESHLSEELKNKNREKYGVDFPMQSFDIMEKKEKNAKKYKEFKMPSGTIRKVQGYEPFALRDLLKTYTEDQIKTDRKEVGRIKYKAGEKEKYYFPDILIPHEKKFIEVKSTWTYKCKSDNIEAKANACREQGYACEIWVYDAKGERVEC